MKGRSNAKFLEKLSRRIPSVKCPNNCTRCCGPIWLSKTELDRLPPAPGNEENYMCPYIVDGKCSVYELRPMICRLFGASEIPMLKCSEGGVPERMLNEKETEEIMMPYIRFCGGMQNIETIGSLSGVLKDALRGNEIDEKRLDLVRRQLESDAKDDKKTV
jgi:Fe-S-cluster containining protein